MPIATRGKVPHFSMRPHPAMIMAMIFVLIMGLLLAGSMFRMDNGSGESVDRGILVLVITGLLVVFLLIAATSKMWFPHLWKKNSSHKRHHRHSKHHPGYATNDRRSIHRSSRSRSRSGSRSGHRR